MTVAASSEPVTYRTDDFVAFARQIRQGRMRLYRRIAIGLVGLALLTVVIDAGVKQPMPWWQDGLALLAALLLWGLASPAVQGRMIAQGARRAKILASAHVFAVSEEGLNVHAGESQSTVKWSAIPQIIVEDGRMFVFVSPVSAYIVPRRAFASDVDFETFADAARTEWKRHHRL